MADGFALNLQGFNSATEGFDLWLKGDLQNRKNFRQAFNELGNRDDPSFETCNLCPNGRNFISLTASF